MKMRWTGYVCAFAFLATIATVRTVRAEGGAAQATKSWRLDLEASEVALFRGQGVVLKPSAEGDDGHSLSCRVSGDVAWARAWLTKRLPPEITPYRSVRLRGRVTDVAPRAEATRWTLRLRDAENRSASLLLPALGEDWQTIESPLGELQVDPGFRPEALKSLTLVTMKPTAQTLLLDCLELIPGKGGWRLTESELLDRVFPKRGRRRLVTFDLPGLRVSTDAPSKRARIAKALEPVTTLVHASLPRRSEVYPLPVYVFKSLKGFRAYCAKAYGWTEAGARRAVVQGTAAHLACGMQSLRGQDLARHLARSLFQRHVGRGGGAWLAEGFASHCVCRLAGRGAARKFAPRLRTAALWSLDDLFRADRLESSGSIVGSTDFGVVRLQAGAFYEFLLTGADGVWRASRLPPGLQSPSKGVQALAAIQVGRAKRSAAIEHLLGTSLEQLSRAWVTWGRAPSR